MPETVLLQHDLPDGSFHYDWMIQPDEAGAGLITFRVWTRIDHPTCRGFEAQRLADHRIAYLTFEGDIGGGRGRVRQLARGTVMAGDFEGALEVTVDFGTGVRRWRGTVQDGDLWRFEAVWAESP